jgi:hypothetical protein
MMAASADRDSGIASHTGSSNVSLEKRSGQSTMIEHSRFRSLLKCSLANLSSAGRDFLSNL